MERIEVLIEKLREQHRRGDNAAQLLVTVQLLQQELMSAQQSGKRPGSGKVAVVMPSSAAFQAPERVEREVQREEMPVVSEAPFVPEVKEPAPEVKGEEAPKVEEAPKRDEYILRKPPVEEPVPMPVEAPPPQIAPMQEAPRQEAVFPEDVKKAHPQTALPFDAEEETPTLLRYKREREVHEVIGEPKESLNDKLKQEKTELAHVLKETPIKDLRKGIGINDKFLFVNELFRGDEAMYERSIKTINGFHILPEAEYWINRELKVKLGWNDSKDVVQHFYHLVRRRFS